MSKTIESLIRHFTHAGLSSLLGSRRHFAHADPCRNFAFTWQSIVFFIQYSHRG
ncbi:MAG: hypothetical protein LBH87_01350 [Coriobacteriales bacterium]|nr:hypothetical protein [Coriobacteriales bacterium]